MDRGSCTRGRPKARCSCRYRVRDRMATVQAPVTLDLQPTHEEQMLREAVRGISSGFGPNYMRDRAMAGEPPTELWDALASRGYLGVNLPEDMGGGGLGMSGLFAVGEELAAGG